jgi:hypothetical protein
MSTPIRLVALLAVFPLALTACGQTDKDSSGDFQGAEKQVAQTVEDLQDASRKKDEGKICADILAPALVAKIKAASNGTCEKVLKDAIGDVDSFELQVKKVTIDGANATATVTSDTGSKDREDTLKLVKVGNDWKIAELGSAPAS